MIDWKKSTITKEGHKVIGAIADRAMKLLPSSTDRMSILMDLEAANIHCPLDFEAMLAADDFNLVHDVSGINQHIDRDTGKLLNCFYPRFAMGKTKKTA